MFVTKFIEVILGVALLTLFQSFSLVELVWDAPLNSRASANQVRGYVPPVGRKRIQRTDGAGSRGCPKGSYGALSLLVPTGHIGLTVSARPTFSWYVSATEATPMQFALVEPGVSKPILVKQLQVKKAGIVQLEVPKNIPELSISQEYRWTVSLVCNAKRPSQNIYVRSWIVRVQKTDNETALDSQSMYERGAFYAESGIWYDAVAAICKAYLTNPQDPLNADSLQLLLEQAGLSQVSLTQQ